MTKDNLEFEGSRRSADRYEPRFVDAIGELLSLGCDARHRPDEKRFNTALAALQKSVRRFGFAMRDPLVLAAREVVDKSWRLDETLSRASMASWIDFTVGIERLHAAAHAFHEEMHA